VAVKVEFLTCRRMVLAAAVVEPELRMVAVNVMVLPDVTEVVLTVIAPENNRSEAALAEPIDNANNIAAAVARAKRRGPRWQVAVQCAGALKLSVTGSPGDQSGLGLRWGGRLFPGVADVGRRSGRGR